MERPYFVNQTMAPTSGKRPGLQDDMRRLWDTDPTMIFYVGSF